MQLNMWIVIKSVLFPKWASIFMQFISYRKFLILLLFKVYHRKWSQKTMIYENSKVKTLTFFFTKASLSLSLFFHSSASACIWANSFFFNYKKWFLFYFLGKKDNLHSSINNLWIFVSTYDIMYSSSYLI